MNSIRQPLSKIGILVCLVIFAIYTYFVSSLTCSSSQSCFVICIALIGITFPVVFSISKGEVKWSALSLSMLPFGVLLFMLADFTSGSLPDFPTARFVIIVSCSMSMVVSLILKYYQQKKNDRYAKYVLILMVVIYTIFFLWVNIRMYENFAFCGRDSTLTVQNVWTVLHGKLFYTTSNRCYHFAQHFQPFLFFMAVIYFAISSPLTLFISRVVFIGLGAVPLYFIARRDLSPLAAITLPMIYFFHPVIYHSQLSNILPIDYTPFLLFFSILFFLKRRFALFITTSLIMVGIRDEYFVVMIMFGVIALIKKYKIRWIIIPFIFGLAWFFLETNVIYPYFSNLSGGYYTDSAIYHAPWQHFGDNLPEVFVSLFTKTSLWIRAIFQPDKIKLFIISFLPLGCFAFLFSPIWLVGIPSILIIIMIIPTGSESYTILTHDVPYLMVLVIGALAALPSGLKKIAGYCYCRLSLNIIPAVLIISVSLSILIAVRADFYQGFVKGRVLQSNYTKSSKQVLKKAVFIIPKNARVVAPRYMAYQLAETHYINIPEGPLAGDDFDFLIIDWNTTHRGTKIAFENPGKKSSPEFAVNKLLNKPGVREEEDLFWNRLISQKTFEIIMSEEGVEVYKRK